MIEQRVLWLAKQVVDKKLPKAQPIKPCVNCQFRQQVERRNRRGKKYVEEWCSKKVAMRYIKDFCIKNEAKKKDYIPTSQLDSSRD